MEQKFMDKAIQLSKEGSSTGKGGPFGCVIVRDGKIVGMGYNQVSSTNDPTAHAEVVAIRNACKNLNSFQLDGCEVYTSCEPCPMCLGAIYWARPSKVFYANTKEDAAKIGFDDAFIYDEIEYHPENRYITMYHRPNPDALLVFKHWAENENKIEY